MINYEALSSDYLADAEGNVIIPPNRWMITFGEDQNYIKVDSKWGLISIGDGGYDRECGVFDREGNAVIPVENRILILDNENGWFFARILMECVIILIEITVRCWSLLGSIRRGKAFAK